MALVAAVGLSASATSPMAYGILEGSEAWITDAGGYEIRSGVYTMPLDPSLQPSALSYTQRTSFATHGAVYAEGYLYWLSGTISNSGAVNMMFNKMDTGDWSVTYRSVHSSPTLTAAYSLAHDYTSGNTYACSPVISATGAVNGFELRTVDLNTGEFTAVAPLGNHYFAAMECDSDGQLYGFDRRQSFPFDVTLYKIDKTSGECTEVGPLGLNQKASYCGAAYDHANGKLYWQSRTYTYDKYYQETYQSAIYEVNVATGAASVAREFDNSEYVSGLFFIDSNPAAPAQPQDVKFNYVNNASGTVSFQSPAVSYRGKTLSGSISAEISVDGVVVDTKSNIAPGAVVTSAAIELSAGAHTIAVTCIGTDGLRSLKGTTKVFSGTDAPAAVSNIQVSVTPKGESATITWDAPAVGANAGSIDTADLTYTIKRRPEYVTIATGLTECIFTDTPDRAMGITQYEITASASGKTGPAANSATALVGAARAIPYVETFDNSTAFYSYAVIDEAGDGTDQGNTWIWHPEHRLPIWWISYYDYGKCANDWMVTPTLNLDPEKVYAFAFDTYGFSSGTSQAAFSVYLGKEATKESLTHFILKDSYTVPVGHPHTVSGYFVPNVDECRIGFQMTNDGKDHTAFDNVRVLEFGSTAIPAAPVLTAEKSADKVLIHATMPTKNMAGSTVGTLTGAKCYRMSDNSLVGTLTVVTAGAEATFVDTAPHYGDNEYYVFAINSAGEGIEATVKINVLPPAPQQVNFVEVRSSGSDAVIEWEYPLDMKGANGKVITETELRYNIYRTVGSITEKIAQDVKGSSYTDTNVERNFPTTQQAKVTYKVEAVTDGGSAAQVAATAIVGPTVDLPYNCSFDNATEPFINYTGWNWSRQNNGYDPLVHGGQDDNWLLTAYASGAIHSPRINLTGLMNPRMTFYLYVSDNSTYNAGSVSISIEEVDANGNVKAPKNTGYTFKVAAAESGWKLCEVDLSKFGNLERASILFNAYVGGKGSVHIDNVRITGDRPATDMRIRRVNGPVNAQAGRKNVYTAVVQNNGTDDCTDVTLEFFADDNSIATQTRSIAAGAEAEVDFDFIPTLAQIGQNVFISARVSANGDSNPTNDASQMQTSVIAANLPYITTLAAKPAASGVELTWDDPDDYPNDMSITDDFTGYENFSISNLGNWTLLDGDGTITLNGISGSLGDYTWPNCGDPQSWIVFNPAHLRLTNLCTPYSGDRCLVCFTCASSQNDDWLISPLLIGTRQTLSFMTRAMHSSYLKEQLEIWVSKSTTDRSAFTKLTTINVTSINWRQIEQQLPAGTRYFAIRCTSPAQFAVMVDNIRYSPATEPIELWGFNIYRNDQQIATEIGDMQYLDPDGHADGSDLYHVTAVYAQGESAYSNVGDPTQSSVNEISTQDIVITPTPNGAYISGAQGQVIRVYTTSGILIHSIRATGADAITLPSGLYIIQVANQTEKLSI